MAIYNGEYNEDFMLGKYCGESVPSSITSTTHKVYIHFHSDSEKNRGFKLEYHPFGEFLIARISSDPTILFVQIFFFFSGNCTNVDKLKSSFLVSYQS